MADAADRHCEALVREADKDRYLAALFAPAEARPALLALYAFNVEIARVRLVVHEPLAGEIRLQWWREALGGMRAGEAAANPVSAALMRALAASGAAAEPLLDLVEARRRALYDPDDVPGEGPIVLTAARFLGAGGDAFVRAADHAGAAYALAHADRGRAVDALQRYRAFRGEAGQLLPVALPAFLPTALVPLVARSPGAPQWRRQLALLRAAWFGFPGG